MKTSPNKRNAKGNLVLKKLLDWALLILTATVICSAIYGAFYWVDEMLPVPKSEAAKVVTGMPKAEVEALLGKPQSITRISDPSQEYWVYSRSLKSTIFKVSFSEGKVSSTGFDKD